jgi:hypothetical protein
LQATQFSAYGTLYQQLSAQASAIHQMLVNTLGTSAGSYGQTEAANQASTGSTSLSGVAAASAAPAATDPSLSSILTTLSGTNLVSTSAGSTAGTPIGWGQNVGAAASDFIALGQGQFVPSGSSSSSAIFPLTDDVTAAAPTAPVAAAAPAVAAGSGGAPVLASAGQASSVGELSVPPSWAADGVPTVGSAPATLAGAGWTSAAPQTAPTTAMPAGMPAVASAGRGGFATGAPRYGTKPTVMPKPTVV